MSSASFKFWQTNPSAIAFPFKIEELDIIKGEEDEEEEKQQQQQQSNNNTTTTTTTTTQQQQQRVLEL